MVGPQRLERLVQRARRLRHGLHLLGIEIVDVLVERLARIDLVLNPVDRRHENRGERKVGIAARIGTAVFEPLGLGVRAIHRNTDGCRAVPLRIGQIDRRLEARHQPLVAVRGRIADAAKRRGMLQDSADGVNGHVA